MVTIKASHIIKPAEPIPSKVMPLSDCDQIKPLTHAPIIYFYRPTTHELLEDAVRILKDSLSKALVTFYPFAGRLNWTNGGRVELHCNSMGALLLEAESELKIDDFGDFSPTPEIRSLIPSVDYSTTPIQEVPLLLVQVTKFSCGSISLGSGMSHIVIDGQSAVHFVTEWAKIARGEKSDDHPFLDRTILQQKEDLPLAWSSLKYSDFSPLPLLIGQSDNLEQRRKETTAVMLKLSKEQLEALKNKANQELLEEKMEGLMNKINQDLHRKDQVETLENEANQELLKEKMEGLMNKINQDLHKKDQVETLENKAEKDLSSKEQMETLKNEASQELRSKEQTETLESKANQDLQSKEQIETLENKTNQDAYLPSKEQVEILKNKANQDLHLFHKGHSSKQPGFSRFEAVSAHIWKCASKARMLKPEQETVLYVTVDFRNRLKPPLPKRYFGNAVMPVPVSATVGDLLSKPLGYAVSKIRKAIENVTDEYVRSYLVCIRDTPNVSGIRHFHTVGCSQGSFYGNPNMIITSWVGLPLYGAKFGWGDEVYLGPGSLGYDGRVFLIPSQTGDGSFLIPLRLQVEHISAFERYLYEEI